MVVAVVVVVWQKESLVHPILLAYGAVSVFLCGMLWDLHALRTETLIAALGFPTLILPAWSYLLVWSSSTDG